MLDKKQIRVIFLFKFKMGCKAAETTPNTNNASGQGSANPRTVQWWFRKSCKGDKSLEDEERSSWPPEVDNDHLRGPSKLTLLQLQKKLPKNSVSIILWSFGIWGKLERWNGEGNGNPLQCSCLENPRDGGAWLAAVYGVAQSRTRLKRLSSSRKVKKLDKWVPPKLTENQTNCRSEVLSSLILCNNKPFFNQIVTCNESGFCATTSSVAWPRRSSKAKLAWKKDYGHCLVVSCPFDPLQLSESQKYHYIWEVCSVNQCDAQKTAHLLPSLLNRKGPILLHDTRPHAAQPTCQKLNELGYKLCLIHHIHLNSQPTDYHFLKHFSGKMNASTISRRQKILSKSSLNPKAWIFML